MSQKLTIEAPESTIRHIEKLSANFNVPIHRLLSVAIGFMEMTLDEGEADADLLKKRFREIAEEEKGAASE
jgi:hypothetical protein